MLLSNENYKKQNDLSQRLLGVITANTKSLDIGLLFCSVQLAEVISLKIVQFHHFYSI